MKIYVLISLFFFIMFSAEENKRFVFVTASYNNVVWCKNNLSSVFDQKYDNWRMIYIDDCSIDGMSSIVQRFIIDNNMEHRVHYVRNAKRRGHLINQYEAIHSCDDDEIIIILDGDDWLAHDSVLTVLNNVYQDSNVWLTYGSYKKLHEHGNPCACRPIPLYIIKDNAIRDYEWVLSHLRTFYAGLYKKIKTEDLMYRTSYFPMCVDLATMYPMFEMAAERHQYIQDILLIYNNKNPKNFHSKPRKNRQPFFGNIIRNKKPYRRIKSLFD